MTAALLCGAGWQPVSAQQAQPEGNGVVGPNEIRDFSLPGTRPAPEREPEPTTEPVTPPRAQEPVAIPAPPAPSAQPRTEPAAPATQPRTAPAEQPQAETVRRRDSAPADRGDEPSETDDERLPSPEDVREALPETAPADAPAATMEAAPTASLPATGPVQDQPNAAAPEEDGSGWLFPLLGALAVLGGGIAVLKLRQRRREEEGEELLFEAQPAPEPEPVPAPRPEPRPDPQPTANPQPQPSPQPTPVVAAAPEPAPAGHVGLVMRPWLELVFRPARATATDGGASVQYEAVIRNTGNAPARNVRLAARMFNAGPALDAEVAHFFALDISPPDGAPLTILPRSEVSLSSVVSMPREEMREIKVQGRSLFIPTVAFNLLYEWGRGKIGQTCSSHVVGREAETPSEKMGPFRLDLGPRIYRSVGQRPSALAKAV